MAVCELHWGSKSLGKQTSATIIFPQGQPGPFPVFYLLHGLSDDHTTWTRNTSLERYISEWPIIVVMPQGERGFYSDSITHPHGKYESFITHDLIEFVDSTFQTIPTREGRVIAGLSMGGYGALKLALKNPHLFRAASSLSGAVQSYDEQAEWHDERLHQELIQIYGRSPKGSTEDIFVLAEKLAPQYADATAARELPALKIDCGTEDFLYDANCALHAHLQKLKVPHLYSEYPGYHNWEYWDRHIPETIAFFVEQLDLKRIGS